MANENSNILTAEQEMKLRQPIEDYVGKIQKKVDKLRVDGTDKVVEIQNLMDSIKRDRTLTKGEKESRLAKCKTELEAAKAVEAKNKDEVSKLITDAENYLKEHFDKDYYQAVKASCAAEKAAAKARHQQKVAELEKEHKATMAKLSDHQEIKDENYVYKNRIFDAKKMCIRDRF